MALRIEKINSLLEHEISKILLKDFAFSPEVLVTLTHVEATGNLIEAKTYISVFPENRSEGVLNALNKSVYDVQYQINRTLKMRPIPKIKFVKDNSVSKADRIEKLLHEAKSEGEIEKE
jgi:ribosome-binding factor A